jgi:hypothetical protein
MENKKAQSSAPSSSTSTSTPTWTLEDEWRNYEYGSGTIWSIHGKPEHPVTIPTPPPNYPPGTRRQRPSLPLG